MSSLLNFPSQREAIAEDDFDFRNEALAAVPRSTLLGRSLRAQKYTLLFPGGRVSVTVCGDLPGWFRNAAHTLCVLARLPANWDSYGALPIRPAAIEASLELMIRVMREDTPPPAVVPTNRGGILLEWHTRGIDLEVEVLGRGRVHVAWEDLHDGTTWEDDIGWDLSRLVKCFSRLSPST